jgi:DNA-directed RNA polymerase subunit RPC12/RpoP
MPIRVKCSNCQKTLSVKDQLAGKKIKCPVCQNVVVVTAASPGKDAPPAAPAKEDGKPAPARGVPAKKAATAATPVKSAKPATGKPQTNGKPGAGKAAPTNGTPASTNGAAKKSDPEPPAPPPEHVEAEALAAFTDEPPPPEEVGPPETIDFRCQWCDEEVKMPMDMAGKQTQCPHPECKRIIKVPLPKVAAKKDWRKMDRRGPAGAIVNMPEELENAWGTESTSRARQDSLRQAGAIEEPEKEPIGVAGWLLRGAYLLIALVLLSGAVVGILRLRSTNQQYQSIREIEALLKPSDLKIKDPVLRAEAHRALGELYLRETDRSKSAKDNFQGALGLISQKLTAEAEAKDKKNAFINEQLFLIDLALSQVELGGTGDDLLTKKKQEWEVVRQELQATLMKVRAPEVQVMALREVGTRLFEKDQASKAFQLAGNLANAELGAANRPPAYRQEIALLYAFKGETPAKAELMKKKPDPKAKDIDANLRVGFAEGYARAGEFDAAQALAMAPLAPPLDRVDASLGVAFIAMNDPKNKAEAEKFLQDALDVMAKEKQQPFHWQQLQAVKIAARLDKADLVKPMISKMEHEFKLRAQYEILAAKCEKGAATLEDLADIEANDKEGTTLGLAWLAMSRQNGASRDQNRKAFDGRSFTPQKGVTLESFRPMSDIGSYLGSKK